MVVSVSGGHDVVAGAETCKGGGVYGDTEGRSLRHIGSQEEAA